MRKNFSLTPKGNYREPESAPADLPKTAAYGHFGRNEPEFTWEATDKAAALAEQAGTVETAAAKISSGRTKKPRTNKSGGGLTRPPPDLLSD